MSNQKKKQRPWSERIEEKLLPHDEGEGVIPVSLILPVYNCSEVIAATLESIESQEYPSLELIIVDAGSTDRTLEIVNSFSAMIARIYTVSYFHIPDMMNRGISLASNRYISFMFPGTTFLSDMAYLTFSNAVRAHDFPDLLYCGSIQREVKRQPQTIQEPFDVELIQQGLHPATLPACWFRRDLFEQLGKFNTETTLRPGYEFFCRIACHTKLNIVSIDRIYVDFDYGRFSYGKALRFAAETWRVIHANFGLKKALIWFLSINHKVMIKLLWRRLKESLFQ